MTKIGLEIHQQLDTEKLFCSCPSELSDDVDFVFSRKLRPVVSELGGLDKAAIEEFKKGFTVKYKANIENSCAVEWDEEPPHDMNQEALRISMQIAKLLKAKPVDEIQVMRKLIIDGSTVSGFQRSALIAMNGELQGVRIDQLCLEEDSARPAKGEKCFMIDRLGIPLVEITTAPDITSGDQAMQLAKQIGELLRMTRVKRGIGTIRQDLNVSIEKGARVEIKGVQELHLIPTIVEKEVERQKSLVKLRKRLGKKLGKTKELTQLFAKSKSKIFRAKPVFGAVLPESAGLFAEQLHEGKHFGRELAEYVRSKGEKGFVHTDEDFGKYQIDSELEKARKLLGAKDKDLIILSAGSDKPIKLVAERMKQLAQGVTKDTRKALEDGSSSYLRPLPGSARMYPETDIPPVKPLKVRSPETPGARLNRLKKLVPDAIAEKLYLSQDYWLFEDLGGDRLAALMVTETVPSLRRKELSIDKKKLGELLELCRKGKLTHGGLAQAAESALLGQELKIEQATEQEIVSFIKNLVKEKQDYIKSEPNAVKGLMGIVMKEFRGRFPGKRIAELLRKEINV